MRQQFKTAAEKPVRLLPPETALHIEAADEMLSQTETKSALVLVLTPGGWKAGITQSIITFLVIFFAASGTIYSLNEIVSRYRWEALIGLLFSLPTFIVGYRMLKATEEAMRRSEISLDGRIFILRTATFKRTTEERHHIGRDSAARLALCSNAWQFQDPEGPPPTEIVFQDAEGEEVRFGRFLSADRQKECADRLNDYIKRVIADRFRNCEDMWKPEA